MLIQIFLAICTGRNCFRLSAYLLTCALVVSALVQLVQLCFFIGACNRNQISICPNGQPCFHPHKIQVSTSYPGFPSFWNYAHNGPMNVSYNNRSILINSEPVLLLSGSIHPSRATRETWDLALDEAVRNGLNMITIYVFWGAHQPFHDRGIDWTLPTAPLFDKTSSSTSSDGWNLAEAIKSAANRGLFVHARIGPYVCAEYSYGGIPEWLPLLYPNMNMRCPDRIWMKVMSQFVNETVQYLSYHHLWAWQGGPIILAQIENEIGIDGGDLNRMDPSPSVSNLAYVNDKGKFVYRDEMQDSANKATMLRNATMQDYAEWCGQLAADLAPNVVWTMCYGLSASNTISTFNGVSSNWWLESHGDTGWIQVKHPPIWSENEGGFQLWGDEPNYPSDYFWGRNARSMAYDALQWFARGGTHLNYYMWWGSYNRGRAAGAGIMNAYATDAPVCPSGERRQPKFSHFTALHKVLRDIAPILLKAPTALLKGQPVKTQQNDGTWKVGADQTSFFYSAELDGRQREVVFVENNADVASVVKVRVQGSTGIVDYTHSMQPHSAIVIVDGTMRFDSAYLEPRYKSFTRKMVYDQVDILDWMSWDEPLGPSSSTAVSITSTKPIEQTSLGFNASVLSDYAWYETDFDVENRLDQSTLFIESWQANAFVVYVDGRQVGYADTHHHKEGPVMISISLALIDKGSHKLSILSESLGYGNLVGVWGGSTGAKKKGIVGDVHLSSLQLSHDLSLVDGREWRSMAGLHGERLSLHSNWLDGLRQAFNSLHNETVSGGRWTLASFNTSRFNSSIQSLFVSVTTGRGHLWLNGNDLGRYWNITRGNTAEYSQQFYHLPPDLLYENGERNELVFFDAFGSLYASPRLVTSWVTPSAEDVFEDEVGYPNACI